MWKRALVSVSDKNGLVDFLQPLVKAGLEIVSTGGTAEHLRKNGLQVTDVSEVTGFPEVMGGRVKTLHPKVHMGLLGRPDEADHLKVMKEFSTEFFDLVVVNLYPFEEAYHKDYQGRDLIEKIDIGGPSMLRAAAKNFEFITVVVDPADYETLLKEKNVGLEIRKSLAAKVFAHTAAYDSLIAQALNAEASNPRTWAGKKIQSLRYGENPQQVAAWYARSDAKEGLHQAQILQGKELSYNNILDLDAALQLCSRFSEPAVVAVKHNNPCGAASHAQVRQALLLALQSDPVSVFGGIVALNRPVTGEMAQDLEKIFLECVIAPEFSSEAQKLLTKKKNLRLLELKKFPAVSSNQELRSVFGGFLTQTTDSGYSDKSQWKYLGEKPDSVVQNDLEFGERVCAALKSNAIAIVGQGQTLGLGMGQVNRVDAVKQAIERLKKFHPDKSGVLISDAFFPFADSIEEIAAAGIRWVLQPGGSINDEVVIAKAKELKVNLVLTGQRHFRH